jgi:predicted O-methyltransferase YrrM
VYQVRVVVNLNYLQHVPGFRVLSGALRRRYDQFGSNQFLLFAPPGHFYSPLPNMLEMDRNRTTLFDCDVKNIPGIDNHEEDQLALLEKFSTYYGELPFGDQKATGRRYYFQNGFFCHADAIALYSLMRHYQPRRIIEVGSGFSSAVMLDTNELFLDDRTACTFVEPYPERLLSLMSEDDKNRHEIIMDRIQNVPLDRFDALQARDILFIDSSHVVKVGSDVVHLLTNVLPRLNKGVLVHFHDIFWPFEYPEQWIREGRAWNECYVLQAFLQFNETFRIRFFNSYLAIHHGEKLEQMLPLSLKNTGGSIWIEKTS